MLPVASFFQQPHINTTAAAAQTLAMGIQATGELLGQSMVKTLGENLHQWGYIFFCNGALIVITVSGMPLVGIKRC